MIWLKNSSFCQMPLFEEIYHKVFELLQARLPAYLTYHSPQHTSYVLEKAEFIARHENISEDDLSLIKLAALFHDAGFIRQYKGHEEAGCEIATEYLEDYSVDAGDIDQICKIIMATRTPQSPSNLNERIMCDADLEYLGTDLFFSVSKLLFQELQYMDPNLDEKTFREIQINFLQNHIYHTSYCKENREGKKKENLQVLLMQGDNL